MWSDNKADGIYLHNVTRFHKQMHFDNNCCISHNVQWLLPHCFKLINIHILLRYFQSSATCLYDDNILILLQNEFPKDKIFILSILTLSLI